MQPRPGGDARAAALRLVSRLLTRTAQPDRVATLAGVLAHVTDDENVPVAHTVGRKSLDDEGALLSESRFRRLLQTEGTDLLDPMRRLVRMTKGKATSMISRLPSLYWGDGVKKDWIFQYYGVAPIARSDDGEPQGQSNKESAGD